MPLGPRAASDYTAVVKASSEANASIGGAKPRGGNSAPPRSAGAIAAIVRNNVIAQIQFQVQDNMPGPQGPIGPIGPTGPPGPSGGGGGSFTALAADIWGGSPPTTAEEAINRLAAMLYLRTISAGPLVPVQNTARVYNFGNAGGSDAFIVKYASDGTLAWLRRIGGAASDQGMGISTDSSGNIFVTGYVNGTATVFAADGSTTAFSLANAGNNDAFIVKYASDGTPSWVRRIGGAGSDQGMGISTDSSGNIIVTGYANGTATVFAADGSTTVFSLANAGSNDAFIVKYANDGTPSWVRRIGGTGVDQGLGISTDSSGNIIVTGYAGGTATVFAADGSTTAFSLANAGSYDAFIVKYASDGTPSWVRRIGGTGIDQGMGISTDSSGNIIVTGYANGTATVFAADGSTTAFSLANAGGSDAFIVKYASDGTPSWVRRIGGTGSDQGMGISTDSSGNIIVTVYTGGTATVFAADGSTTAFSLANAGNNDAFIVKYASDGTPSWVRRIGGTGVDIGFGISTDSSGNIYITGINSGPATVFAADGSTSAFSIPNFGLTLSNYNDGFIVKYASDGTPISLIGRINGTNGDQGLGISTDLSGNIIVTGYANGTPVIVTANM